jgi:hypothetical protein
MKTQVLFLLIILVTSCKKQEPDQSCGSCPVGGSTSPVDGFSYVKNGGSAVYADSAFFNSTNKTITSYYHGIATRVNIKTTSQAPGTYTFTVPGNTLSYTETSFTYIASGGSIIISSNSNNKLTGNFVSNGTGGGIVSLTGQFQNIPLK